MITQLEIKLKYQSEEKLNYNISSVMHGILMGHIDRAYGERMHEDGLKPFVQEVCNIHMENLYDDRRSKDTDHRAINENGSVLYET